MTVRLDTLGGLAVHRDGEVLPKLTAQRVKSATLLYLALERETSREAVSFLLWAGKDQAKARHSLSQTLYELRSDLGDGWLDARGERLAVDASVEIDAARFRRVAEAGRHGEALDLYRGPFLAGWHPPDSKEFETWAEGTRAELERLHARARARFIVERRGEGDLPSALDSARVWAGIHPLSDEAQHTLIELLDEAGQRAEALQQYDRYASRLRDELEVEPLAETKELVTRIRERRTGRAPLSRPQGPVRPPPPSGPAPGPGPPHAIAVLPFLPLTTDAEHRIFCDGLTEEVTMRLSELGSLRVTSRTSAMAYRDAARPAREIAAELGVGRLLQGSVRSGGGRLRISAQLVDPQRDAYLWSDSWDRDSGDVLATQTELADRIAGEVRERLEASAGDGAPTGPGPLPPVLEAVVERRELVDALRGLGEGPAAPAVRAGSDHFQAREEELDRLTAAYRRVAGGQGAAVGVRGEPGIGKSALILKFREALVGAGTSVWVARCRAPGALAPYQPVAELVGGILGVDPAAAPEERARQASRALRRLAPDLLARLPVVLELLGVEDPAQPLPPSLVGPDLRNAINRAVLELLARLPDDAGERPPVLILEDWHDADDGSDGALDHLLRRVDEVGVLVVVVYRSRLSPRWRQHLADEISVEPLGADDTAALARALLGVEEMPAELPGILQDRTGGNPFFVEEACRALVEDGTLVLTSDGRAVAGRPLDDRTLPGTVETLLRGRIGRLDRLSGEALALASVLGARVPRRVLERLVSAPERLPEALDRLHDLSLLSGAGDREELEFRHQLTTDVAYRTLLRLQRMEIHGATGRTLEELIREGQLEERAQELAYHFARSADAEKAVHWLERAGDRASRSHVLSQARQNYRQAMEFLERQERTPDRVRARVDLAFKWAEAGMQAASSEQVGVLEGALRDARSLGDRVRETRAVYWLGWIHYALGDQAAAIEHFERCQEMAEAVADDRFLAQLYLNIGQSYAATTEYQRGLEYLRRGIALRRSLPDDARSVGLAFGLGYVGMIHGEMGRFDDAARSLEEALDMVTKHERISVEGSVRTQLAMTRFFRGDWEACLEEAGRIREIAERIGSDYIDAMSRTLEGFSRVAMSGDAAGIDLMREAIERLEESGARLTMSWNYACLAWSLVALGDAEEGRQWAERALARREVRDHLGESLALRTLARIAATGSPPDLPEALRLLDEAAARGEDRGSERAVAEARYLEGVFLQEAGETGEADAPLQYAQRAYESMGMTAQADKVRRLRAR